MNEVFEYSKSLNVIDAYEHKILSNLLQRAQPNMPLSKTVVQIFAELRKSLEPDTEIQTTFWDRLFRRTPKELYITKIQKTISTVLKLAEADKHPCLLTSLLMQPVNLSIWKRVRTLNFESSKILAIRQRFVEDYNKIPAQPESREAALNRFGKAFNNFSLESYKDFVDAYAEFLNVHFKDFSYLKSKSQASDLFTSENIAHKFIANMAVKSTYESVENYKSLFYKYIFITLPMKNIFLGFRQFLAMPVQPGENSKIKEIKDAFIELLHHSIAPLNPL